jgi:hypothetical protein
VVIVNARETKNLPGRKSDVQESQWLKANGTGYIVMAYVEGDTLRKHLRDRGEQIAFDAALQVLSQVMNALEEAFGEQSQSFSLVLRPGYAPEEQYWCKGHQGPYTDIYALTGTVS